MKLTALVLGSGFAGQGHTQALRACGVEVVGMVSRTAHVVRRVAADLAIPYASTDWEDALVTLQPDIVAIGTPGGAHVEPILTAIALGCHVFCDKPLAATAADAVHLTAAAHQANVKTAYAASYRYEPYVLMAKELIAEGFIGEPQELECVSHFNLNPLIPFGWSHRADQGGGRLNNNFTHKLSIVEHMLGGYAESVTGSVRNDMHRAPVVSGVHDFRERRKFAPDSAEDPNIVWKTTDVEWSYTVQAQMSSSVATRQPVSALFQHSGLQPRFYPDHITVYGSDGAIHLEGHYGQGPMYVRQDGEWAKCTLAQHVADGLPKETDSTLRNWTMLARSFVADIRGEPVAPYQTFVDGMHYQQIIDAVRNGTRWTRRVEGGAS